MTIDPEESAEGASAKLSARTNFWLPTLMMIDWFT
jgi:hypothetical protein